MYKLLLCRLTCQQLCLPAVNCTASATQLHGICHSTAMASADINLTSGLKLAPPSCLYIIYQSCLHDLSASCMASASQLHGVYHSTAVTPVIPPYIRTETRSCQSPLHHLPVNLRSSTHSTARHLPLNCMAPAIQLHGTCHATAWHLPLNYMAPASQLHDICQ